jgi:hypothetical protein
VRQTRQEEIFSELRDHFAERVAELQGQGADRERAAASAMQEFGDAAALAAQFMQVIRQRRRRLIMRSSIGVMGAVMVAVMAVLAFWPADRSPVLTPAVAQESAEKPDAEGKQQGRKALSITQRDKYLRAQLASPSLAEFVDFSLDEVVRYFEKLHDIEIYVKWRQVDEIGLSRDSTITMSLKGSPLDMTLELLLDQLHDDLAYIVQKGILIISTKTDLEGLESNMVVYIYNTEHLGVKLSSQEVEELIGVIRDTIDPRSWSSAGGHASIRTFEGPPEISVGHYYGEAAGYGRGRQPEENARLPKGVMPQSAPASISSFQGLLVINQTPENHERITDLLIQLEKALQQKNTKQLSDGADSNPFS